MLSLVRFGFNLFETGMVRAATARRVTLPAAWRLSEKSASAF
jgi:hypothetical protein